MFLLFKDVYRSLSFEFLSMFWIIYYEPTMPCTQGPWWQAEGTKGCQRSNGADWLRCPYREGYRGEMMAEGRRMTPVLAWGFLEQDKFPQCLFVIVALQVLHSFPGRSYDSVMSYHIKLITLIGIKFTIRCIIGHQIILHVHVLIVHQGWLAVKFPAPVRRLRLIFWGTERACPQHKTIEVWRCTFSSRLMQTTNVVFATSGSVKRIAIA